MFSRLINRLTQEVQRRQGTLPPPWPPPGEPSGRLPTLLEGYPPFEEPFPGDASKMPLENARANLDYLVEQLDARITLCIEFFAGYDINLGPLLDGSEVDIAPTLRTLNDWIYIETPTVETGPGCEGFPGLLREINSRAGNMIAYSLIKDISIFLSEIVVRRRPGLYWGLWLDPSDASMDIYKEPAVLGLQELNLEVPVPVALNLERLVLDKFYYRDTRVPDVHPFDSILTDHYLCCELLPSDMRPVRWPDDEKWAEHTAVHPESTED